MEDGKLAARALAGDDKAFGQLVDRHGGAVFTMALRMTGDRELARDLAQDTFVKAWTALKNYDRSRPLAPWLLTIAVNLCRDALTKNGRDPAAGSGPDPDGLPRRADGPEEAVLKKSQAQRVEAAVLELPPNLREAVVLRFVLDLDFAHVAQALGTSTAAAKMRVYRALDKLKARLDGDPTIQDRQNKFQQD